MKYYSLFRGIGGLDLGFDRAGMVNAGSCEIDPRANAVARRYWTTPVTEDIRNVTSDQLGDVDLICGGFPCQDVSVAGRRAGLAGERSGLWFEFHRLLREGAPGWVVIENVPGLLSSHRGRDFAVVLQGLAELGYGVSWRVLDAQYFGVPQRRRRVFIVGHLGDGRSAEVLFERAGVPGDPAPGREAGQSPASGFRSGTPGDGHVVGAVSSKWAKGTGGPSGDEAYNLVYPVIWEMQHASEAYRPSPDGVAPTLQARRGTGGNNVPLVGVRRLTPIECERLQGFPDGWTDGQPDSVRHRQLGNAVNVAVAEWLGRRIMAVNGKE